MSVFQLVRSSAIEKLSEGLRGKHPGAVRLVHLPFETEEEMRLVSDDWTAEHKAPLTFCDLRLREVPLFCKEVFRGQAIACRVGKRHAAEGVGPLLGDDIDDRCARAAILRPVHAGHHVKFLDRLERRAHLRAKSCPEASSAL